MSQSPSADGWTDPTASSPAGNCPDPVSPAPQPETVVPPPPQSPLSPAPAAVPSHPVYPGAPYGAPSSYGYPQYGYAPTPQSNGMAIAAMVLSIIGTASLCAYGLGGLLGLVGAILGHVARRQIRERGESGDGMAVAGIIVGWITFGLGVLIIGVLGVIAMVAWLSVSAG